MPVICYVHPDPTDVVIQGSLLADSVLVRSALDLLMVLGPGPNPVPLIVLMNGTAETPWPDPSPLFAQVRSQSLCPMNNATISTPCGALIDVMLDGAPSLGAPSMSTTQWSLVGATLDAAGAPLPGCRVIVMETGRLAVGEAPVVAEAISSLVDGSFTIPVPGNTDYQIMAYLPGSPDVAGVTLHPLTPTSSG